MKIERQVEEVEVFKPVTLTVTLESQEEIDVLYHMLGRDVMIPEMCYGDAYWGRGGLLSDLMGEIRGKMF